jgi:hypothetical protein
MAIRHAKIRFVQNYTTKNNMSGLGITKFNGASCSCCSGFLSFLEGHFPVENAVDIAVTYVGVFTGWRCAFSLVLPTWKRRMGPPIWVSPLREIIRTPNSFYTGVDPATRKLWSLIKFYCYIAIIIVRISMLVIRSQNLSRVSQIVQAS